MANQGYKRTNFEEEEYSSAGATPTSADYPPAQIAFGGGSSGFSIHRPFGNRTQLETRLIVIVCILLLVVGVLIFVEASRKGQSSTTPIVSEAKGGEKKDICLTPNCVNVASTLLTSLDSSIDPCDDFYAYACRGWTKSHPIPSGHSSWNTFQVMTIKNLLVLKNAIDKPMSNFSNESERKAKRYFTSCMDPDKLIEEAGAEPLHKVIAGLNWGLNISEWDYDWELPSLWNFNKMLEDVRLLNIDAFFTLDVAEDDMNSKVNILQIDRGELPLNRDSHLNKTVETDKVLKGFLKYMKDVYKLLGAPNDTFTDESLRDVIEFESSIASIPLAEEEREGADLKKYFKYDYHYLTRTWPCVDWFHLTNHVLSTVNLAITLNEKVVVYVPKYLTKMCAIIEEHKATEKGRKILTNYLMWHVVEKFASYLSKPFRDARDEFTEILSGQKGNFLPWSVCLVETNAVLGYAMGALFVSETFTGESKEKSEEMVENVRRAFMDNLNRLTWMDKKTLKAALDKAMSMNDMFGFPAYIMDDAKLDKKYESLEINENDYFGNNLAVIMYSIHKNYEKLDKKPDRNEWSMTPPTVNAYYKPNSNTMVFPAGILQAPFFDVNHPKSLNYGAIGVVMGHELTHGFDDQGRGFDKYGNLNQWWQNKSVEQFKTKAQCFIDQYSSYSQNGENLRGKQTLGENIADNGGIKSAYYAYRGWVERNGDEELLPGLNLTHNQLFFLAFAQVWCFNDKKEYDHLQLMIDNHSPSKFRVIGTLSNSVEFSDAYKCKAGSPMNPKQKCKIW